MDYTKLEQWRKLDGELKRIKAEELALRKELFELAFFNPIEGTNVLDLTGGWALKATYPMTRSLDQEKMPEVLKALKKAKVDVSVIKVKYELSLTAYKELDPQGEGCKLVDAVLTTKPGTPSFALLAPKGTPSQQ